MGHQAQQNVAYFKICSYGEVALNGVEPYTYPQFFNIEILFSGLRAPKSQKGLFPSGTDL